MPLIHAATPPARLKVRYRSGLTPNFELLLAGVRGFVGVRANHEAGEIDPKTLRPIGALESHDEIEELPARKEYVMAIAEGHLWACDEYTAKRAAEYAGKPSEWAEFLAPDLGNRKAAAIAPPTIFPPAPPVPPSPGK